MESSLCVRCESAMAPICTKGGKSSYKNHKGFSLASTAYNTHARIIFRRLPALAMSVHGRIKRISVHVIDVSITGTLSGLRFLSSSIWATRSQFSGTVLHWIFCGRTRVCFSDLCWDLFTTRCAVTTVVLSHRFSLFPIKIIIECPTFECE